MNIVQNKINPHIYINQIFFKKKLEFRSGNSLVSLSPFISLSPTITLKKFQNPNPKLNPVFFHQLRRDKTQRHSTITQRQNSNPDFWAPNTKLNTDFLMLSKKPNTKLKTQIPNR